MTSPVRRRRVAALSAVSGVITAVALLAACTGSSQPAGPAAKRSSAALLAGRSRPSRPGATGSGSASHNAGAQPPLGVLGSYRVSQRRITFVEPAHTGPTGSHLGSRSLLTLIRYPTASRSSTQPAHGPLPLIVFGPGFMQCGGPYSALLQAWATAGYVVVVVNFPHADCKVGAAATEADMVNEPGDMSYLISKLLALSAAPHGLLSGLLDRREIAVSGHSDGADTVAALTANTCCADYRIAAVAVLSGAEWAPMPGRYFSRRPAPMLFTQGSADTINLPVCSVQMYRADPAHDRYYLDLFGASHTIPYWGADKVERIVARVTLAFFNRFVLRHAAAGPQMKRDGDVSGLAALFSGGAGHLTTGPCPGA